MIYFVQDPTDRQVKIGWSRTDETFAIRLSGLKSHRGCAMTVLRTIEAEPWVEEWIHRMFHVHRIGGEWFEFHPDMLTIQPPSEPPIELSEYAANRKTKRAQGLAKTSTERTRETRRRAEAYVAALEAALLAFQTADTPEQRAVLQEAHAVTLMRARARTRSPGGE